MAVRKRGAPRKQPEKRVTLPDPVTITLPPSGFHPSKADMDEEFDMPGASEEQIRRAFFRPVIVKREG